ncbi:MAG: hypothetical protein ACRD2W_23975 [Acidimicrobiales bacterium]
MARRRPSQATDPAAEARKAGITHLSGHPLFRPLLTGLYLQAAKGQSVCPASGWAVITGGRSIDLHPTRRGSPAEWTWVLAHCLVHFGFGHVDPGPGSGRIDRAYNVAACLAVNRFLLTLKIGRAPDGVVPDPAFRRGWARRSCRPVRTALSLPCCAATKYRTT